MNYIIFDLEWNNAYNYATNGFMNDIIEIGAVKLDSRLNIVDTFKQLIKPNNFKKLSSRCKNLTKITNEEIKEFGIPFDSAFSDFARWSEGEKSVFLSWSNSDLFVLVNNFRTYMGTMDIDFMEHYCDAQKYCMSFIDREDNNQIALSRFAEMMEIDVDTDSLHRALTDCYVTAEIFKKLFDKSKLDKYISDCDKSFFERLLYKPYYITEPKSRLFDIDSVDIPCPACGGRMQPVKHMENVNKTFRGATKCTGCGKMFWTYIRAKKTYDDVVVSVNSVTMSKKKARRISNNYKQK